MESERDPFDELSPQEQRAVGCLLVANTLEAAAQEVGVHPRTLRRWLGRTAFLDALRTEQRAVMQHIVCRLQVSTAGALDALDDIVRDPSAPAHARVAAAKVVLELARDALEMEQMKERIEKLESEREPGRVAPWP